MKDVTHSPIICDCCPHKRDTEEIPLYAGYVDMSVLCENTFIEQSRKHNSEKNKITRHCGLEECAYTESELSRFIKNAREYFNLIK